ncbi:MAG TPA: IS1634 family transposase [candidate division Zixibacteria bacterium]|nr:IS1634 family transposase [candidate division Zixibacteria bacterium]
MFVRVKPSGPRQYLQIVENFRENGRVRQRVIATLGRVDLLAGSGAVDGLMKSLGRFARRIRVVEGVASGRLRAESALKIGPALLLERLWDRCGARAVIEGLLRERAFEFPVERAVFLSVLHRLFDPGSDRQADRWKADYRIEGADDLRLHHLYRAMRWLGEERERIEEGLFGRRKTLFSEGDLVFFDTTSIYFEGRGGETLGRRGHSKDHRPDLPQMVVGAVMDAEGAPICAPMWPGNRADVTTLAPLVEDLRRRFGIRQFVIVADRGMIAKKTVEAFEGEKPAQPYILGARMRRQKEVSEDVLGRAGRYQEVEDNLHVKEVRVAGHRYVVCRNPEEAERDAAVRQAILDSLREKLKSAPGALVGNRGYRRFVSVRRGAVALDEAKIRADARYDGKYVLRTNTDLPAEEVARRYKELWRVERLFRDTKSLLDTRPIFHHLDATILGHVFVSFLALAIRHELDRAMTTHGVEAEWFDLRRDIEAVQEIEVRDDEKRAWLRTPVRGAALSAFHSLGMALPAAFRE